MVRIAASSRNGMLASDFWNNCAVPAKSPWMEIGTSILAMVRLMAFTAVLIGSPAGRLKEKVVATNTLWGLTAKGVVPGPKVAKADRGTMVETLVEMLAPVEEPPRAPVATALSCWLRAASWAACCAAAACWVAADELDDRAVPLPCDEPLA